MPLLVFFSVFFIFIALLSSCQSTNSSVPGSKVSTSPAFDKVIEHGIEIHDTGNVAKSMLYVDSAYKEIEPPNVIDKYNYFSFFFNAYSRDLKNFDRASLYADSMLWVLEKNNCLKKLPQRYAQSLFSKGDALFGKNNFNEAYEYFYKAKKVARDNLDSCELDDYTYRLGIVLYQQEHFEEAADNFKQSFTESAACEYVFSLFYRRQELLDNIGLCYYKANNFDSALVYFNSALEYIDANQKNFPGKTISLFDQARAVVYGNMASIYDSEGDEKKAEELYNKSISINSQKGYDVVDAQLTRLKLAKLYLTKSNIPNAQNELNTIKTILDTIPNQKVQLGWYNLIWQYYKYKKELPASFNYLARYSELKDSLDRKNKLLRETDMTERMKNLDEQYQISILQKNDELKKNYLIIALISSVLSLIILLLIFENWRKSTKNYRELTNLNNQVNEQNSTLEKLLAELELSNREKDRILRAVAHDIRNPIAAISSLTGMLIQEGTNYSQDQLELLEHIKNACSEALNLSRDILEAADPNKLEAIDKEWTNLNKLLKDSISLLQFRATEKKQNLVLKLPDAPTAVSVNKEKIWRVISNLVINAIKFSPEGSTITVAAEKKENGAEISVHDNGIGIPNKIKDKVFDMFTEAKRLGTLGEKPFGLGLSISKQIVEAHGGKIWFESSPNKGTTFFIFLPEVTS